MKKLTALVLSIGMMFSMAACGGPKVNDKAPKVSDKALDTLESSIKKLGDLKSASYNVSFTAGSSKESMAFKLAGDFILTGKPQFSSVIDQTMNGKKTDSSLELYIKDNTLYFKLDSIPRKAPLEKVLGSTGFPSVGFDADTFKLQKKDMKPYLNEASVEGNNLKLVFDTNKINDEIKKNSDKNKGGLEATLFKFQLSKLSMNVTLQDGFLQKATISYAIKIEGGQDVNGDIIMEFNKVNSLKSIPFPDFSDYREQSELTPQLK